MSSIASGKINIEMESFRKVSIDAGEIREFETSNEAYPNRFDAKRGKSNPRRWQRLPWKGKGHMENGIASTVIGKLGTSQIERTESHADCFDPERTKRGPRRWERLVQTLP